MRRGQWYVLLLWSSTNDDDDNNSLLFWRPCSFTESRQKKKERSYTNCTKTLTSTNCCTSSRSCIGCVFGGCWSFLAFCPLNGNMSTDLSTTFFNLCPTVLSQCACLFLERAYNILLLLWTNSISSILLTVGYLNRWSQVILLLRGSETGQLSACAKTVTI